MSLLNDVLLHTNFLLRVTKDKFIRNYLHVWGNALNQYCRAGDAQELRPD